MTPSATRNLVDEEITEADWNRLTDEERLAEKREEGEEQLASLTSDQVQHLRRRAKNDLFFLAKGLLGYDLLSTRLHGSLTRFTERTRDSQYRLFLLPRGHYKSTVITISESVQMALPNIQDSATEWPYTLGPNIKLLIAHENAEESSRFLYEIAQAFLEKPAMLALFPECIPNNAEQRINKWEFELPREQHHKEPTFDTIGTGGSAQGRHYNWIKLDDVIGKKQRDSETKMKRAIEWFDNMESLLTRVKRDGWDLIGTRWSYADVYSHAIENYGVDFDRSLVRAFDAQDETFDGDLVTYARGAVENNRPIFPEEFSMDFFKRKRQTPWVWAAQYANNPKEGQLLDFKPAWLKYYNVDGNRLIVFDGPMGRRSVNVHSLDVCILCDPSVGESEEADDSGIVVTGTDENMNIYILETVEQRLNPPELVDELIRLQIKYSPRLISIEEVAFSAMLKYWLQQEMERLGIYLNIHPYKPGSQKSKEARIRGLANYFSAGQIYVHQGMFDFRDEYEQFPMSDSDHLLDALAQGPEVWTESMTGPSSEDRREAERKIQAMRNAQTGY